MFSEICIFSILGFSRILHMAVV